MHKWTAEHFVSRRNLCSILFVMKNGGRPDDMSRKKKIITREISTQDGFVICDMYRFDSLLRGSRKVGAVKS